MLSCSVSPLLAQSLAVPPLTTFGQGVVLTYLLNKVHALHVLEDSKELVLRSPCHLTKPREGEFAIPLKMLSHTVFTDRSGLAAGDYVTAVCAQKIALVVISSYLLAATDRTGSLRESQ